MALDKIRELTSSLNKSVLLAVLILTVFGLFLRFYALGSQSVWLDEAISGTAAEGFLKHGFPTLPSGNEYSRAILHTGLVAISFGTLGQTTAAGRVPAAIFGALSIPLAFLLGRKIKNRRVGILLAFFMTFATVQIAWSRQIRMYQQLQFFFLLSLYLLERLLDEITWKRFLPLLVSLFCMTLSHQYGYLLAFPIVIWFLLESSPWLWDRITNIREVDMKNWVGLASLITLLSLFFLVRGIPWGGFQRLMTWEADYSSWYIDHFSTEMGPLFLLGVLGALLGVLDRKRNLLYIISFLIPFYVVSTRVIAVQDRYVFMLFPVLFAFLSLSLDYIYERARIISEISFGKEEGKTTFTQLGPPILIILILIPAIHAANFTFTPKSRYNLGPTAPQAEFRPAYNYIERNWEENDVVISTLTPVTWYYLKESDYWISFSFWGLDTVPKNDRYTDAETIRTVENLKSATKNAHGWVVIDPMGLDEANRDVLNYIDESFDLIENVSGRSKRVWVYEW